MTQSWLIGSNPDCDIVVSRTPVSAHHCRLVREGDGVVLEDLGSAEGTFVNGAAIDGPTRLTPGDAVTLGPATPLPWPARAIPPGWQVLKIGRAPENDFVVNQPMVSSFHARLIWDEANRMAIVEDLESGNGTAVGSPDRKATRSALAATDTVYLGTHPVPASELLARLAPARRASLTLRGPEMTIGRDPTCDLVLALPMVSSRHARLSRSGSLTLIEDLGSANGTSVNGQRIDRAVAVKGGDVIGLGSYLLEFAVDEVAETAAAHSAPPATASQAPGARPLRRWAAAVAAILVVAGAGTLLLLNRPRPVPRPRPKEARPQVAVRSDGDHDRPPRPLSAPSPISTPPRPAPGPIPIPELETAAAPAPAPIPRPAPSNPKPAPSHPAGAFDLAHLTPRDETKLGRELHALILKHHQVIDPGDLLPRIQAAEEPLLARRQHPVEYTYTILDSDEVNAFSHPGGYIYLSWGLFTLVASTEELQFVLAHEIAHLANQHAQRGLMATAAETDNGGGNDVVPHPAADTVQRLYRQIAAGYPADQEYEADRRALEELVALGHTRRECLAFLRKFKEYAGDRGFAGGHNPPRSQPEDPAQDVANHYCAHPAAAKRLKRLEDFLGRLKPVAKAAPPH